MYYTEKSYGQNLPYLQTERNAVGTSTTRPCDRCLNSDTIIYSDKMYSIRITMTTTDQQNTVYISLPSYHNKLTEGCQRLSRYSHYMSGVEACMLSSIKR